MAISYKPLIAVGLLVNFCVLALLQFSLPTQSASLRGTTTLVYAPQYEDATLLPWNQSLPWQTYMAGTNTKKNHQNFLNERDYCGKVKKSKDNVLLGKWGIPTKPDRIIFCDYHPSLLVKRILNDYSTLVHPQHHSKIDLDDSKLVPFNPLIDIFITLNPVWHYSHQIGVHFLCQNQRYNHIPGNSWLNYKDVAANSMRQYATYYLGREHCFDPWTIMPYTLDLTDQGQCEEFAVELEKHLDSKRIKWMVKKSRFSHNGKGISIIDQEEAYRIKDNVCPWNEQYLAQKYIENPMLILNRKFDFRAYLVIASMDPLMIMYHDGFIKLSLEDYDPESSSLATHLTNTRIAEKQVKSFKLSDEEKNEMLKDQSWSFKHFEDYMVSEGLVEKGWLDSYVRAHLKNSMFHMVRMHLDKLLRHPRIFEMYGLDYLMDTDLRLWFIETNLTPSLGATTKEKEDVNTNMFTDLMNMQYALLYEGNFDRIVEESNFHWIYDGRLSGINRYHGNLSPDCI